MRIVSLVPAATEIVCAIGRRGDLFGRSHECDYPPDVAELPAVTRPLIDPLLPAGEIDAEVRQRAGDDHPLYDVDSDVLASLVPDLVITQGACEVCAVPEGQAREIAAEVVPEAKVLSLSPVRLADVADDIERVAEAVDAVKAGEKLRKTMAERFRAAAVPVPSPLRVLTLEWLDPPMLAGHWTPEVVAAAGCIAAGPAPGSASTTATWKEIDDMRVDGIIVAPCGFDLDRTRREAERDGDRLLRAAPRVLLADGNAYFNRPGPRLVDATEGVAAWLTGRPLPDGFARFEYWV